MQVFLRNFLVGTKPSASKSNDKTDYRHKDSTSKNESGQSQFIVKSSLLNGDFSTLHNHHIGNRSVVLKVRTSLRAESILGPFLVISIF